MQYLMRPMMLTLLVLLFATIVRAQNAPPPDANKMCPVMTDQPTRADRFVDYQGKRIYFCCEKCIARFQKEPGKFVSSTDQSKQQKDQKDPPAEAGSPKEVRWSRDSFAQLFGRLHV